MSYKFFNNFQIPIFIFLIFLNLCAHAEILLPNFDTAIIRKFSNYPCKTAGLFLTAYLNYSSGNFEVAGSIFYSIFQFNQKKFYEAGLFSGILAKNKILKQELLERAIAFSSPTYNTILFKVAIAQLILLKYSRNKFKLFPIRSINKYVSQPDIVKIDSANNIHITEASKPIYYKFNKFNFDVATLFKTKSNIKQMLFIKNTPILVFKNMVLKQKNSDWEKYENVKNIINYKFGLCMLKSDKTFHILTYETSPPPEKTSLLYLNEKSLNTDKPFFINIEDKYISLINIFEFRKKTFPIPEGMQKFKSVNDGIIFFNKNSLIKFSFKDLTFKNIFPRYKELSFLSIADVAVCKNCFAILFNVTDNYYLLYISTKQMCDFLPLKLNPPPINMKLLKLNSAFILVLDKIYKLSKK